MVGFSNKGRMSYKMVRHFVTTLHLKYTTYMEQIDICSYSNRSSESRLVFPSSSNTSVSEKQQKNIYKASSRLLFTVLGALERLSLNLWIPCRGRPTPDPGRWVGGAKQRAVGWSGRAAVRNGRGGAGEPPGRLRRALGGSGAAARPSRSQAEEWGRRRRPSAPQALLPSRRGKGLPDGETDTWD